jgi:DivIVA domain-containing protein
MSTVMVWALAILAVAVIGVAVVAGTGRFGGMAPQTEDRPGPDLPAGRLGAKDLRQVRFAAVLRGYDMNQVDAVLDRMADQLDAHDVDVNKRPAESNFTPRPTGLGWPQ